MSTRSNSPQPVDEKQPDDLQPTEDEGEVAVGCSKDDPSLDSPSLKVDGIEELDPNPKLGSRPPSRGASPPTCSREPPREVLVKSEGQLNRYELLEELSQQLQSDQKWSALLLDEYKSQVEDLNRQLNQEHTLLESLWSADVDQLPYFKHKVYSAAQRLALKLKRDIAKLRAQLPSPAPPQLTAPSSSQKLPDISLPHFTGRYSEWPYFKDMFQHLIYKNPMLSPVQKLHHLRSCLSGEPAQIVSAYDLSDSSLEPAMKDLRERYNNRRLIIQSYLDKLLDVTPLSSGSAQGLNKLARSISEVKNGLASLKVEDQLGDMLLVCLTVRNLDRSTRESWETTLDSSREFPTTAQIERFLHARARALERVEYNVNPNKASQTPASKAPSHQKTTPAVSRPAPLPAQASGSNSNAPQTSSKTTAYSKGTTAHPCDYCGEGHYIVACTHFRRLSLKLRLDVVERKGLCYNCLGRHAVHACKNSCRCKTCNSVHHTMLHGYKDLQDSSDSSSSSSFDSSPITTQVKADLSSKYSKLSTRHP